jgi:hypothetical protein
VTAFVGTLIGTQAHADKDDSIKRWSWGQRVCPLVAGLPQAQGEFMLARLSEAARRAKVPLAPEKCQPNFYRCHDGPPRTAQELAPARPLSIRPRRARADTALPK